MRHKARSSRHSPGSVVAKNLHPKYTRQEFFPTIKQSPLVGGGEGRAEVWFPDIDTKALLLGE